MTNKAEESKLIQYKCHKYVFLFCFVFGYCSFFSLCRGLRWRGENSDTIMVYVCVCAWSREGIKKKSWKAKYSSKSQAVFLWCIIDFLAKMKLLNILKYDRLQENKSFLKIFPHGFVKCVTYSRLSKWQLLSCSIFEVHF